MAILLRRVSAGALRELEGRMQPHSPGVGAGHMLELRGGRQRGASALPHVISSSGHVSFLAARWPDSRGESREGKDRTCRCAWGLGGEIRSINFAALRFRGREKSVFLSVGGRTRIHSHLQSTKVFGQAYCRTGCLIYFKFHIP